MKKANVVGGSEHRRHGAADRRLTLQEMDDEMDRCERPWLCPESCYSACIGCLRRRRKNNGEEI